MEQADFSYGCIADAAGLTAKVSVFSDRSHLREQIGDDLRGAGFQIGQGGVIADLLDGDMTVLGDVVILDCPSVDAASIAALSRLDMRVARSGAQLIIGTAIDALDTVFSCFDQSAPQILVDATPADRILAIGRVLGSVGGAPMRELSEADRLTLLRLTDQVETIARRIERLDQAELGPGDQSVSDGVLNFRAEGAADRAGPGEAKPSSRIAAPSLPDPRLVRQIIRQRQARARFFDGELFADPAWDMLLDLTAAHAELHRVSVSSLCIASGVPATTALRWIRQMTEIGLFERVEDSSDKRRVFISLSDRAVDAMARYFAETANSAVAVAA